MDLKELEPSEVAIDLSNSKELINLRRLGALLDEAVNFYNRKIYPDVKELQTQLDSYKKKTNELKEQYDNKSCGYCADMSQIISFKNNLIKLVVSVLSKVAVTRNIEHVDEAIKLLCDNISVLSPTRNSFEKTPEISLDESKQNLFETPKKTDTPFNSLIQESFINEESVIEIDSTPTGRESPILSSKVTRNKTVTLDKNKGSLEWATPISKVPKLSKKESLKQAKSKSSPKLRQTRIIQERKKSKNLINLNTSLSGGVRSQERTSNPQIDHVKASIEDADIILPSPTSENIKKDFSYIYKTFPNDSKISPKKIKRQSLQIKKSSPDETRMSNDDIKKNQIAKQEVKMEEIQIKKSSPDETLMSFGDLENNHLAKPEVKLEEKSNHLLCLLKTKNMTMNKEPLVESTNIIFDNNVSISLLQNDNKAGQENLNAESGRNLRQRSNGEKVDFLYKEETVRKKAEKRLLPGWSCIKCKEVYSVLYKDDPEMLAKKMDECSKHRGRSDPNRPKTPEGYWDVRWSVPEDTEEFNKQNNAT